MKFICHLIAVLSCGCMFSLAVAQQVDPVAGPGSAPAAQSVPGSITPDVVQAVIDQFRQDYPKVEFNLGGPGIANIYGIPFGFGSDPNNTAEQFVAGYSRMFGVEAGDLAPAGPLADGRHTQPVMWNQDTGEYKFTMVYYSEYRGGVSVFRSDIRLLVRNDTGYPLVWVGSSLRMLGAFQPDFTQVAAVVPEQVAPDMLHFSPTQWVIWAGVDDQAVAPVLAWTFEADNEGSGLDPQKWLYVVEASTGSVLYRENRIIATDVTGVVHGMATTLPKSAECNPEVDMAMPYAKVAIGTTTAYANAAGNFTIPSSGTAPVTVTSYMSGQYFNVVEQSATPLETLTLNNVTPPGPANFMHDSADTSPAIIAQVNAYVQANKVRDWGLAQNPSYPTIATQTGFTLNVNINSTCNAYYDGSSLNFYLAGGGCANTAYSSVVHHEYGHHFVSCGGSGQDEYGEGMSDCLSALIADDPVLGYGFQDNCNAGIRDADNTMQYPCSGEIHYCGQLISGCVWDTRTELLATHPDTYRQIVADLTVNSILMHSGGQITRQIYTDFLVLDDNDGDLTNGTPHYTEIHNAFAAHNMVPPPPPGNDACVNAINTIPNGVYSGTTMYAAGEGSSTCGTGSAPDVWYKYTAAAGGLLTVDTCAGASFDTVLSIHSACPGTTANQLACNNDACGAGRSTVVAAVTAGTTYYIRVSGNVGAAGSFLLRVSNAIDSTPPTPNPMTFATAPNATGTSAINMRATQATETQTPPVSYYFECVSDGPGANSSGWQTALAYNDLDLQANTSYSYRVKARDSALPPNEGEFSPVYSATTLINQPNSVAFGTTTAHTIELTATGDLPNLALGNAGVYFDCVTTGGDGGLEDWVHSATAVATGLGCNTAFTYRAKARNQEGVETDYCGFATKTTPMETPSGMTFGLTTTESIVMFAGGTFLNVNIGPSGLYFDSTTPGGNGGLDAWIQATTDTATGLSPNTLYSFRAKGRNQEGSETPYGPEVPKATLIETPVGLAFGTTTDSSIGLQVTGTLSNLTLGASGVYFDSTNGGNAGIAEWVQTTTDTATGLSPDRVYSFRVRARNQQEVMTSIVGPSSKRTLASVPAMPMLGNPMPDSMTLDVNPSGNPATTVFAVQCTAANPADANWTGKYLNAAGNPSAAAVWQTDAAWGVAAVHGLAQGTTYTFAVKARNGDGIETAFGPGASLATGSITGACCDPATGTCTVTSHDACTAAGGSYQGDYTACTPSTCPQPPTGACCDPATGACSIATQSACAAGAGLYQGNNTTCTPNPCEQPCTLLGDVNTDGTVNGLDIDGFVRALLGLPALPGENPACAEYGTGGLETDLAAFVADLLG